MSEEVEGKEEVKGRVIVLKKAAKPAEKPAAVTIKKRAAPKASDMGVANLDAITWNVRNRQVTPIFEVTDIFKKTDKSTGLEPWQQGVAVGDKDAPMVGVAFPSFCWEMFTSQTILPVSAAYILGGPTGAFKSHLAMEIAGWVAGAGGVTQFIENEVKYNPDMAKAVMGYFAGERVHLSCPTSFTQVQDELTAGVEKMDKEGIKAGRKLGPFLQIVDSIVGNATEAKQKKVHTEGHSERDYPDNALAAANYLPSYVPNLANKPYIGLWITHYSEVKDGQGPYARTIHKFKGGGSWEYRARMGFIIKRVTDMPKYDDRVWTVGVVLAMKKDAGIRAFRLPVIIRSGNDIVRGTETDGVWSERRIAFGWDESSMALLQTPERYGYPEIWSKIAKELLGLKETRVSRRKVIYAEKLGVTPDNSSCTATEIMDALYANTDILDRLRAEFGINKGLPMTPEIPFETLQEQATKLAARRLALVKEGTNLTYIKRANLHSTPEKEDDDSKSLTEQK
jgi:hypothetical protein